MRPFYPSAPDPVSSLSLPQALGRRLCSLPLLEQPSTKPAAPAINARCVSLSLTRLPQADLRNDRLLGRAGEGEGSLAAQQAVAVVYDAFRNSCRGSSSAIRFCLSRRFLLETVLTRAFRLCFSFGNTSFHRSDTHLKRQKDSRAAPEELARSA